MFKLQLKLKFSFNFLLISVGVGHKKRRADDFAFDMSVLNLCQKLG